MEPDQDADQDAEQERALVAIERAMIAVRRSQTRRALGRLDQGLGPDAVDPTTFGVLDAVEGVGRPSTVGEVAAALGVDQPRASRLVTRAVDDGLLVRLADQSDGRRAPVALTALARARLERVHRFRQETFGRATAGWSDEDRVTFARLITSFVDALGTVTEPPDRG
ncbi:MarR family winged helix-turn-helix transcriptional regulator [Streptomyces profundus]|uniref:MarR family winged helix-turn-helix transcriptional regulator n=1 Tax=Streptomyces profundus TaxID=2867410 RepID=UPI001D161ABD|nr:MarR family winged helix-turn-helix transcriptional regulator [Streptomyces sp. MA3_2.13]UED87812.1 MarR family winged helix-turn-helix transcriptional regulator [Streptomyces sp. MA3_2.13]